MDAPADIATSSTIALLERLVHFDTTSRNSNLELIDFIRAYLDQHGIPYRVSRDPTGQKANIHAIIGPRTAGGIALSGHVDTVPVDGQAWSGDPFTLRRHDATLVGRGACDMKGFVAACLAAVPMLKARGLARPVHLFISYDEEVGCGGARRLIEDLSESGLTPSLCIVGEPSGMQPILAHKGKLNLNVKVRGKPGHSSDPAAGVNAVQAAAEAIAWVARDARRLAAEGPFMPNFDPGYTTVHVGTMRGGTILNVIPEHAEFTMEWRHIPGDSPHLHMERMQAWIAESIEPPMRAVDPACGFAYDIELEMPGMALPPDHELAGLVKQLTGSNSTGAVSYGTEGGFYEKAGIPTIICGPGHIAQAHQPDEWIAVSELAACDAFIRKLADRLGA
ncbi:acetylornithine deacetylase [Rhodopila sp.]|uniref:acetylornithine deacetylase n=1 Tax=Rhodopila sp. TaxID=2480087 RepID=UPI002D1DCDF6|nr:acetylornithine deacetylase [Rhodopila sp.]HVZ08447.1 acetylornithine deacetylase [Rhodopila sp.]